MITKIINALTYVASYLSYKQLRHTDHWVTVACDLPNLFFKPIIPSSSPILLLPFAPFCQHTLASPVGVWQLSLSLGSKALFRNHYKTRNFCPLSITAAHGSVYLSVCVCCCVFLRSPSFCSTHPWLFASKITLCLSLQQCWKNSPPFLAPSHIFPACQEEIISSAWKSNGAVGRDRGQQHSPCLCAALREMVASVWHFIKCPTVLPYPASPVSLTGCCVCWCLCVCVMFRISGISDLPQAEIFYSVSVLCCFFSISPLLDAIFSKLFSHKRCSPEMFLRCPEGWPVRMQMSAVFTLAFSWTHSPRKMIRCWNYVSSWAVNLPQRVQWVTLAFFLCHHVCRVTPHDE